MYSRKNRVTRREILGKTIAAASLAAVPNLEAANLSDPVRTDSVYRIHPAIGVARMGNADPSTFFIGPEVPGYGPLGDAPGTTVSPYKVDGLVKPQASRFRVFEYRLQNGAWTPYREVSLDTPGVGSITWNVHLANKKASFHRFAGPAGENTPSAPLRNATVIDRRSLEIDFGPRSIGGASQAPVSFSYSSASSYPQACPLDYQGNPVIAYLGQLRTDAKGRLIVIGGQGKSSFQTGTPPPLKTYANNDGWFDDASDGPVTATVTIQSSSGSVDVPVDAAGGAWVLCTPPDFAPRVRAAVTMYDLLFDLGVRSIPIPANNGLYASGAPLANMVALSKDYTPGADYEFPNTVPDFNRDIFPILRAGYEFYWVTALVTAKHQSLMDPSLGDPSAAALKARQGVFVYLRPPLGVNSPTGNRSMPHLKGDDPYTGLAPDAIRKLPLTHVQFALMRSWSGGNFVAASAGTPPNPPPAPPPVITPDGLDRAALENCAGGGFFPGIEASWQIRNPKLYIEPFRLNLQATSQYLDVNGVPEGGTIAAGHFSRQMAVPWQADFNDCRNEGDYGWWPSQRPDDALPYYGAPKRLDWARADTNYTGAQKTSHADMVANWWKYAFVVQQKDQLVETERTSPIP
jgi:hypothetical protein